MIEDSEVSCTESTFQTCNKEPSKGSDKSNEQSDNEQVYLDLTGSKLNRAKGASKIQLSQICLEQRSNRSLWSLQTSEIECDIARGLLEPFKLD